MRFAAVYSEADLLTGADGHRRPAFWAAVALVVGGLALVMPAVGPSASEVVAPKTLTLEFEGRVEPLRTVTVANRVDGVIDQVLFNGGETVAAGDPLFVIDPSDYDIALKSARAAVALAEAQLRLAEDIETRQSVLIERGTVTRAAALEARTKAEIARADLAQAKALLAAADLSVERTKVAAPISGHIGRPLVARGAFVEAEAGTALAEIVQLDPVLVGYAVPYAARMNALTAAGATSVTELFQMVTIELVLPGGQRYPHQGTPHFESARIDPASGSLTTWAVFPNSEGLLVPGLEVGIISTVTLADPLP